MKREIIKVEGMSCGHCENAIKQGIGRLEGVKQVEVDLSGKTVQVEFEESIVELSEIKKQIEEEGYDVVDFQ